MRVLKQSAFILHRWPYSETSWLLDVFTKNHGRVSLLAKGARRLKSPWRSILQPFLPLTISFSGKGEVQTLTAAESQTLIKFYDTNTWLCSNYINELLIKLLHRHDAHESLFDAYSRVIKMIEQDKGVSELILRQFETFALKEIGYGIVFDCDVQMRTIEAEYYYEYHSDIGAKRLLSSGSEVASMTPNEPAKKPSPATHVPCVSGHTLQFLSQENIFFNKNMTEIDSDKMNRLSSQQKIALVNESKQLLRYIIQRALEWRQLKSRDMFVDVKRSLV